jgi:hypothetical protein
MAKADEPKSAFRRCLSTITARLKLCRIYTSAPKGAAQNTRFSASLKRYPDTNRAFSASCEGMP